MSITTERAEELAKWLELGLGPDEDCAEALRALAKERDELKEQLAAAQAEIVKMRDGMRELACLGNGDLPGNSIGNCIARKYLELPSDDTALRQLLAEQREAAAKIAEEHKALFLADSIRTMPLVIDKD